MRTDILTTYRFFAATLVVMFHFAKNTAIGAHFPVLVQSGPEMVTFFFVLSGFIMGVTCLDNPAFQSRQYWWQRFSRIYPAYLFGALLMMAFFHSYAMANNTTAVLLHVLMLQAWVPHYALAINGPGWSLSVEAFFYAVLPLIIFLIRRYRLSANQTLLIALLLWLLTQVIHIYVLNVIGADPKSPVRGWVLYFPLSHWCSFLLGLVGYQIASQKPALTTNTLLINVALALLLIIIFWTLAHEEQLSILFRMELPFESSLLSPLFLALILVSVNADNGFTQLLTTPLMRHCGEASYGIYILQKPLWMIYKATLFPFVNSTLHIHLGNDIHFVIYLLLLIAIALRVLHTIENPIKRQLRKIL